MNVYNSIKLRPATSVYDEGLLFAKYLDTAAEDFFALMIGKHSANIIATAYAQPGHDLSYQHVTFAVRDNVIVGMASGYTAEQHRLFSDQPLRQAAGTATLRMMCISALFTSMLRFLRPQGDGEFYLQAVAVDKAVRGQGVGSALMDAMEDRARAGGSTRFSLDVSQSNEAARRLYGRRGMAETSKWPRSFFMPRIIVRMTKSL